MPDKPLGPFQFSLSWLFRLMMVVSGLCAVLTLLPVDLVISGVLLILAMLAVGLVLIFFQALVLGAIFLALKAMRRWSPPKE